ncbi:hypothetical protein GJ633_06185 [Halorubrum sp. CBA1125]|uniref:hypothetical protein n=1 Tax=Halorubrum sp. CBA1125 TaxID=2668072 RepID=UPI0012E71D74|nr:hypothetical protein [Halorubrum sp. CBA1125]MUW14295.1 hypothetical protein [Halorubrum sp. CBA1125]
MAVLLAVALVFEPTTVTDGGATDSLATTALFGIVVSVPLLAVLASVGAWRGNRRLQWGATGGLLILGIVPYGVALEVVLVSVLVVLGLLNTVADHRWYDVWLALSMLVSLWGVGSLLVVYTPGHSRVMVVVGGLIILGATLSVVAASTGTLGEIRQPTTARELAERSSFSRFVAGVAHGPEWRLTWIAVVLLSITVTVFHFFGLAWRIYTRYWFWDVITHSLSGFGVAAIIYLLRPATFGTARRLFLFLPVLVFTIGAVFEVYEYVFREFYYRWSVERYLRDTLEDLVYDTIGAVIFAYFPYTRLVGSRHRPESISRESPTNATESRSSSHTSDGRLVDVATDTPTDVTSRRRIALLVGGVALVAFGVGISAGLLVATPSDPGTPPDPIHFTSETEVHDDRIVHTTWPSVDEHREYRVTYEIREDGDTIERVADRPTELASGDPLVIEFDADPTATYCLDVRITDRWDRQVSDDVVQIRPASS